MRMASLPPCLSVTLVACAGGRRGPDETGDVFAVWVRSDAPPLRRVLPAPVEAVWAALPDAFIALGFPGGPSARGERMYLTPSMTVRGALYQGELNSVYLDCGRTAAGGLAADVYAINFAILARLTPQDSTHTLVEVLVDGTARDRGQSSNSIFCTGTGRLETALVQRLETRIGSGSR